MTPKKTTAVAKVRKTAASDPVEKETVALTIEVDKKLHRQILGAAKLCGYTTPDEFLRDAIKDSV